MVNPQKYFTIEQIKEANKLKKGLNMCHYNNVKWNTSTT